MSKVLVTEQYLSDIGSAIRAKAGTSEAFKPAQMASAIEEIGAGGQENEIIDGTISGSYENSKVTTIKSYVFRFCSSLTAVSFPAAIMVGEHAFNSCIALTTVSFPNVTSIKSYTFGYCYALATVSFPVVTSIGPSVFRYCYNLLSLYLLGSSVPTLASRNVFTSTPIAGYTTSTGGVYGSIYVPASLYNSYITATNWAAYSSRFVSV